MGGEFTGGRGQSSRRQTNVTGAPHGATANPLLLTLVLAGVGALVGGVSGAVADGSTAIANPPTAPTRDAEAHAEGPTAREGDD